ncbi:MAG: hypothetical protein IKQ61_00820 [Spirochaetales bacterium]|nr:hypothetical protein [Spirochaetales bacterium]
MIDFFQTINIKRFIFVDCDNASNAKLFIFFLIKYEYLNLETQVICFLGANQNQNTWYNNAIKYIQSQKSKSSYNITPIRIKTEANNALDMVISSYCGLSMAQNSHSEFIIVSNDNGYSSIIEHFTTLGINIQQKHLDLQEPSVPKQNNTENNPIKNIYKKIDEIKGKSKDSLPIKEKSFKNFLLSTFRKEITKDNINEKYKTVIEGLIKDEKIKINLNKIEWL